MGDYNVSWKGFFAKVISAWSWPIVFLVTIMIFRGPMIEKLREVVKMGTGGIIVEFAVETKAKLIDFERNGINSEADLKELERLADSSGFILEFLSAKEKEGAELNLVRSTFTNATQMLEGIEELKKIDKAGIDTRALGQTKEYIKILEELKIDPNIIKEEDGVKKVVRLVKRNRSTEGALISEERISALENENNLKRFKKNLEGLDKIKVDPRQIRLYKVKPALIREFDIDTARFEKYRKLNLAQRGR